MYVYPLPNYHIDKNGSFVGATWQSWLGLWRDLMGYFRTWCYYPSVVRRDAFGVITSITSRNMMSAYAYMLDDMTIWRYGLACRMNLSCYMPWEKVIGWQTFGSCGFIFPWSTSLASCWRSFMITSNQTTRVEILIGFSYKKGYLYLWHVLISRCSKCYSLCEFASFKLYGSCPLSYLWV